ncbi:MAG: Rpn family recombination-promoting nuclease/putative transposase [Candidatus Pseudobacter hemicellulosilyticus]|uniref:Rpn family recombination-promoting nuclease/putative transposase n=1 Tax=Candidatus Pseudobacter hemicellulosilyticus TaxID=3121375 RepID=A0AAJ6BHE6_9BACT|nr:MAG: Rpn family recombination-promoting nuclease/putative transposase [Pseudobacter sp.]
MEQAKKEIFLDPLTDFGFKKIFGDSSHKALLVDLLNALIRPESLIVDIFFRNTEVLGALKTNRKAIFDICATDTQGSVFIIEIQRLKEKYFLDRSLFYASVLIREQEQKGDWNFSLVKTHTICFMDFCFDHNLPGQVVHEVKLVDVQSGVVFNDRLMFCYVELPKFNKTLAELVTRADQWLFLLKNLGQLTEVPTGFDNDPIFKLLFMIAEWGNLDDPEYRAYMIRKKEQWDLYAIKETAREDGMEEGREEGIKIALAKVARQMKLSEEPIDRIAAYTGLAAAEILGME